MSHASPMHPEAFVTGLGWPEGPAIAEDGSLVLVESYRSQLTIIGRDGQPSQFAYVAGAPNSCVPGDDGLVDFPEPVFPNGIAVEADGSIVWDESYTGRVGRLRPDGRVEDLGRLPGHNPIPDGLKVGADGRLYVTDIVAGGIHVLSSDGRVEDFIACGVATTNCVFSGDMLLVTNAGVLATGTEPSFAGTIVRVSAPGGGGPVYRGSINSETFA